MPDYSASDSVSPSPVSPTSRSCLHGWGDHQYGTPHRASRHSGTFLGSDERMNGAPPEGILRNEEGDQAHLLRLDPSDRRSTVSGYTKTIGIVGGMSWASTITYYRVVCEETIRITEGKSCGSLKIISFDSSEIERIIEERRWQMLADRISAATRSLVEMGSDIVLVASNTAHVALSSILVPCISKRSTLRMQ